jgi:hypothetical protein
MLITSRRPKLPKFAAWPVTTQRMESAAADTSHLVGAKVHYSDYKVNWLVSQPVVRSRPYQLLEVNFTRQWEPEGEWTVRVRAVPAEHAPRIRKLVEMDVLPRLQRWLVAINIPAPNSTRPVLSFVAFYNELNDELLYDEAEGWPNQARSG